MKVTIEKPENEKQEIVYPCLMGGKFNQIILCFGQNAIVLDGGNSTLVPGNTISHIDHSHFTLLPKGTKVIIEQ